MPLEESWMWIFKLPHNEHDLHQCLHFYTTPFFLEIMNIFLRFLQAANWWFNNYLWEFQIQYNLMKLDSYFVVGLIFSLFVFKDGKVNVVKSCQINFETEVFLIALFVSWWWQQPVKNIYIILNVVDFVFGNLINGAEKFN